MCLKKTQQYETLWANSHANASAQQTNQANRIKL